MESIEQVVDKLLRSSDGKDVDLFGKVEALAEKRGQSIYRELLFQLTGKPFSPSAAQEHWHQARVHHARIHPSPNAPKTLRPALLDYLYRIAGEIADPRILEAEQLEQFRLAAATDGLTGLFNQTYFKLTLGKLLEEKTRGTGRRFAVVLMDLDRFKQYNDRCGHLAGDKALEMTASIIKEAIRLGDIACRYGGEEFGLLLHRVTPHQAFEIVERIRRRVEQACFPQQELLSTGNLTISCGIALHQAEAEDLENLLKRADTELYRAKVNRNTVSPSPNNKRIISRQTIQTLVDYAGPRDKEFETGLSLDVSTGGMALVCQEAISPGSVVTVRFRQPFWKSDHTLNATVRSVTKGEGSTMVRLGLEFCKNLSQDLSSLTQNAFSQDSLDFGVAVSA